MNQRRIKTAPPIPRKSPSGWRGCSCRLPGSETGAGRRGGSGLRAAGSTDGCPGC
ncbi:LOW QUALITY PROTEIN: hypothetical protein U0070_023171 [Myodes glareolus]|uniref:Uncharacterized protein n=1 Tax=Myodes glareolus TaxID=447135 RepID=A0AAW0IBY0_MYOGA